MENESVLVTGATGFIGSRLVRRLILDGKRVLCLARTSSDVSQLEGLGCSIAYCDLVKQPERINDAIANVEIVYHLAASTHTIGSNKLVQINTKATNTILQACATRPSPPTIVLVSSLAAVGPSSGFPPHTESTPRNPVSFYGQSKSACEQAAINSCDELPISIVRPPIVLGEGDRHGIELFRSIDNWGVHLVPGFSNPLFSVIHVDDLVAALTTVAERGERLTSDSESQGIYFASSDEIFTYADLGRLIGKALGKKRTRVLRVAKPCMWTYAVFNEIKSRYQGVAEFLNLDKFAEAFAGSWTCSNEKLKQQTGFHPSAPMLQRMIQTVDWYRQHKWLKPKFQIRLPSLRSRFGFARKARHSS